MEDFAVLVGNDINNINPGNSWSDLLSELTEYLSISVDCEQDKPFPLEYEEVYFKAVKNGNYSEGDIKKFVSKHINKIGNSFIHEAVVKLNTNHIMTTNYDLCLESTITQNPEKLKNRGFITESKYNIFRNHIVDDKVFWHVHGSANAYLSITLGYEHYNGYLQHMRNYVVSGTKDTYKKKSFLPLTKRFKTDDVENQSWLDLFFTKDVHIIGLSLDFNESDLWWLLTFREKSKYSKSLNITNNIYYYIPEEYVKSSKSKIDMLRSVGVTIVSLKGHSISKANYYTNVIDGIARKYA
ncbi:hypothetical protein ACX03_19690 [Vibrio parahaemolyticus]|nr:hypothetical protein ACX03_19690 [Vibrio parahaemolyticus]